MDGTLGSERLSSDDILEGTTPMQPADATAAAKEAAQKSEEDFLQIEEDFLPEEADESIITLIDDEGRRSEFEVLDAIDVQEGHFVALLPLVSVDEENEEAEYIILQVVTVDGEEEFAEIEDETLLNALADLFMERFHELYD